MITKDEIKAWLTEIQKDRGWLAERCGVSKSTVNNWLSTSISIPNKKLQLIDRIMIEERSRALAEEKRRGLAGDENKVVLSLSDEDFQRVNDEANRRGMRLTEYFKFVLTEAARHDEEARLQGGGS